MTGNDPFISVIIPTYNCARFLMESVGSVLSQTYRPYEIIVIDDGSTDNTKEVLQPVMQRIKYVQLEQNKGSPVVRNIGIQAAQGEYVAFLDADDVWLPEKLQTDRECFDKHPDVGMVYSKHINIDEKGVVFHGAMKKRLPCGKIFVQLFSEQNFIITSSVVVRKAVFETTGLFDEQLFNCQDWDMWLRIAFYFKSAGIDKPLVKYRHNPHSLSKNRDNVLKYQKLVIDKTYAAFKDTMGGISEKLYHKRLASHYAKAGRYYVRIGDKRLAHENFRLSLKHDPLNLRTLRYYFTFW